MKKIISFLFFLVLALAGLTYYLSMEAEKQYNKTLANLDNAYIKVNSSEFRRGFLSSNATTIISVLPSENEEAGADGIKLKVTTNLSHSPLDLVQGSRSQGFVEVESGILKEDVVKFFGANRLFDFDVLFKMKNYTAKLESAPISNADGETEFKMTPVKVEFAGDEDGNLYSVRFIQDSGRLTDKAELTYSGVDYLIEFIAPFNLKDFDYMSAILNSNIKFKVANFGITGDEIGKIKLSGITSSTNVTTQEDNIKSLDKFNIDSFEFEDIDGNGTNRLNLNQISLDTEVLNLSKAAYINLILALEAASQSDFGMFAVLDAFNEILEKGLMLKVHNFSMKNDEGKNMGLNFILGIDTTIATPPDMYDDIMNKIIFSGEFRSDVTLKEFFSKLNNSDIEGVSSMLIDRNIMQKSVNGYISKFKYDLEKADIIVNDGISLFNDLKDNDNHMPPPADEMGNDDINSTTP